MLWLDRRRTKECGRDELYEPLFSAQPKSIWSAINTRRVAELTAAGRMDPAGLTVFRNRDVARSNLYSYERERTELDGVLLERFESNPAACRFFESQSPSYRRTLTSSVMSAKKDETRRRRLDALIEASARGMRMGLLSPTRGRKAR